MSVESQIDFDAFCDPSEFGSDAVISTASGPVAVTADFGEAAVTAIPTQAGSSSFSPLMMQAANVTTATLKAILPTYQLQGKVGQGDTIAVPAGQYAGTYRIIDVRTSGPMTALILHRS